MADPVIISLTKGAIELVTTNQTSGFIHAIGGPSRYVYSYRDTGNAAPTDKGEFVSFSEDGTIGISASAGIDVYVISLGENGKVRIDL